MSDFSSDVFSTTGTFSTPAKAAIFTRIMLDAFGQNLDGPEKERQIEYLQTEIFTENSAIVTWQNGEVIYRITWEPLGLLRAALKCHFQSWKTSRPDIAVATPQRASAPPSPASPDGGNGPPSACRLTDALQRLLAGDDISSEGQETIRLYAKLLLSCLNQRQPTE